jgi:hypothetical protein
MPKKIDTAVKERALRMFADHRQDYPSDTALAEVVATTDRARTKPIHAWRCGINPL